MLFAQKFLAHIFQNVSGAFDPNFSSENGVFVLDAENAFETNVHVGFDDRLPKTGAVAVADRAKSLRSQVQFVGFEAKALVTESRSLSGSP